MDIEQEFEKFVGEVEATRMPMEAPFVLVEKWEVGVVYHQEYKNGDRTYFRADSVQKNTRWKGMSVDEIGGKQKKPKNNTADEKVQGWKITPKDKIPKGLKEEIDKEVKEGIKDLPPHLQKSLKDFEKKQKKLKSQFPDLKTKTFVYNPETGKPDIEIKEKIMDLKDTIKQVIIGETKEIEIEEIELSKEDAASFISAASKAKQDGKKKFKIGGKEYPVTIKVKIPEERVELKKMNKMEKKEQKSFSKMFSHIKSLMQGN